MVRLNELYDICRGEGEEMVKKLREWTLVPKEDSYNCSKCKSSMRLQRATGRAGSWEWACTGYSTTNEETRKSCRYRVSLKKETFFDLSNLSILQILSFAHMWSRGYKLMDAMHELEIGSWHTVCDWSSFCREVCLSYYVTHLEKLGGPCRTVEIDESKFGKRKYHRGHHVEGCWVFGGVERETGRVFMEVVVRRDANTLIPLLEKWVEKGTTVMSDCWKAYDKMEGFVHMKVNHSLNFGDPETGTQTNTIESTWRHAKESFSFHGRKKAHVPGNLARYMFQKACRCKKIDPTEEFFRMAGIVYDPTREDGEKNAEVDDEDVDIFD